MALVANQPNNAWYQRQYHNKIPRQAECRATLDTAYAGQGEVIPPPAPAISLVSAALVAGVSRTFACAAGDIIFGALYGEGGSDVFTSGTTGNSGMTLVIDGGASTDRGALYGKVATGAETTFGHAGADRIGLIVLRPANGVGGIHTLTSKVQGSGTTTLTFPALNTANDDNTSWIVGMLMCNQGASAVFPSDLTNLAAPVVGSANRRAYLLKVDGATANWDGAVVTWSGSGIFVGLMAEAKVTAA